MKKFAPFIGITLYSIMLFAFTISSCSEMTPEQERAEKEKTYFLEEKFVLIGTSELGNTPTAEKIWLVQRLKEDMRDTVELAELNQVPQIGTFAISNELWYSKKIGDTLYFDYILRGRFFKVPKRSLQPIATRYSGNVPTIITPNPYASLDGSANIGTPKNKMEIELEMLRLERELTKLKEELNKNE